MKAKMTDNIVSKIASRRIEGIAQATGALAVINRSRAGSLQHDLSTLQPEDILALFHQKKIREKDAMFWLGVIAINAEEKAQEHQTLAVTDALTQVYNRRAFIDVMSKELARLHAKHIQVEQLKNYDLSMSLIMVDIDHFKKINDTFGHVSGDVVLHGIAKILKDHVRDGDSVYRYGGEEFAVILPETSLDAAARVADRMHKAIQKARFMSKGTSKKQKIQVTVSMGITTVAGDDVKHAKVVDTLIPHFIARADSALYHAKETGRNKISVWSEELEKERNEQAKR